MRDAMLLLACMILVSSYTSSMDIDRIYSEWRVQDVFFSNEGGFGKINSEAQI